jgi:hypothetical protein
MNPDWEDIVRERLQLYGHRNWLVIADSAYPAQCRHGIETILADEAHTEVIKRVFAILGRCKHVAPSIYTDQELGFIAEEDAPGVTTFREELSSLMSEYELRTLPHEEVISRLDRVGEKFKVLLIKTNMSIPYTSLFLELECRYWNSEAENRLRAAMRSRNGHPRSAKRQRKVAVV